MQPSLIFLILMLHGLSFPVLLLSVYPCHWIGNWFLVNRIYIWLVHDFFKIHSVNLCLLIGLLWPLTFHIIICVLGLKFSILFLVFCLVFIFFLFFFSFLISFSCPSLGQETYFRICLSRPYFRIYFDLSVLFPLCIDFTVVLNTCRIKII